MASATDTIELLETRKEEINMAHGMAAESGMARHATASVSERAVHVVEEKLKRLRKVRETCRRIDWVAWGCGVQF